MGCNSTEQPLAFLSEVKKSRIFAATGSWFEQHGLVDVHLQPSEEVRGSVWREAGGDPDAAAAGERQVHVALQERAGHQVGQPPGSKTRPDLESCPRVLSHQVSCRLLHFWLLPRNGAAFLSSIELVSGFQLPLSQLQSSLSTIEILVYTVYMLSNNLNAVLSLLAKASKNTFCFKLLYLHLDFPTGCAGCALW